ncbi:hypothetical protein [Streptomyces sp. NPDC058739]|uniref:hypothetical protein n=1 Tax=Streptomyces sp. NPDC058739 TaxID=3346618 RepID=UPI003688BAA9
MTTHITGTIRPRGRHRRPRPRGVLLTAGGLALAAGALSLVRLAPDSGLGGIGTAEAEPRINPYRGTERASHADATDTGTPRPSPSATTPLGGAVASPLPSESPEPAASEAAPMPSANRPAPAGTGIPQAPSTPTPRTTPPEAPPASTPPSRPEPTPAQPTAPPSPTQPPKPPGLCVPVIGLCIEQDDQHAHHGHARTTPSRPGG